MKISEWNTYTDIVESKVASVFKKATVFVGIESRKVLNMKETEFYISILNKDKNLYKRIESKLSLEDLSRHLDQYLNSQSSKKVA